MLVIIILTALTGHCVCVDELQVDIESRVTLVDVNATFNCRVRRNKTSSLEIVTDHLDVQWTFSPVGSNNSYIILNSKDNDSFGLVNSNSATQPTNGNKGEDSRSANEIKYLRVVWPHLSILNVEAKDAGTYTCRLIDSGLTASAELYVLDELPSCTKNNSGPTYFEDETVTFNCSLSYHGNHPPQLNWEPPDMNVDLTHLTTTHDVTRSQISCGLHVRLQHMIDGKLFTCSAKFVNITNVFTCHDLFPPESVQYKAYINHLKTYPKTDPHNHTIELGSTTTLFCMAHGNPAPTWTWSLKNDKGMMNLPCSHEGCKLTNVTYDNTGTYKCTVSNVIKGQTITSFQVLSLKVIPKGGYPVNLNISQTTPSIVVYADTGISPYAIGAIVCASLAVILILVFILLALKMRTRERNIHQRLTRMHDENLDDQEVELLDENIQPDTADLPVEYGRLKQQWEIARKDIRLVDLIAKGTFVEVWRGRMRKYPRRNDIMKVAIKRIISEATEKERKFFLADLEVMKAIQTHCNVLPLIGCYTASDPWLAMVEFAVEGSLYQYLQHRRPGDLRVEIHTDDRDSVSLKSQNLTAHKLLALAAQVVNGLQHINKFKMIFYRLRAASVLVCKGGVCKLSGFGFIQDITERNLYEMNSAPTRWMSPESLLDNVFNVKTDVWAFGILLWEIVHFGHLPYPDMGPHEVSEKIHTGYRMSQPPHCSGDIYNLMLMCWAQSPDNRPSLGDIMQNLAHLAENADAHINIDKLPEGLKSSDIVENSNAVA